MDYLRGIPDPRSRQGRRYPLPGILAMLILASLQGEKYLRGMWVWAQAHQEKLLEPLDFLAVGRLPALATIWNLLAQLDVEALEQEGLQALQVVTAAAQQMKIVLRQSGVEGDELDAAIALLEQH